MDAIILTSETLANELINLGSNAPDNLADYLRQTLDKASGAVIMHTDQLGMSDAEGMDLVRGLHMLRSILDTISTARIAILDEADGDDEDAEAHAESEEPECAES